MEWRDEGVILSAARFGESDAILDVLTHQHGRHLGLMKGGLSRTRRADIQTGNLVALDWRARLPDQLGNYTVETIRPYAALTLDSPVSLAGLTAATAVTAACLPEREAHPKIFAAFRVLLDALVRDDLTLGASVYVKWELGLLQDLGFGLDLASCAVTGETDDLTHVSPRTGRAVSRNPAKPYCSRLLRLPPFLLANQLGPPEPQDIADGLRLTGHFLSQSVLEPHRRNLPAARESYAALVLKG